MTDSNLLSALHSYQEEVKPYHATLVAISKTKPQGMIQEAYQQGQRDFGENKAQEMTDKHEALPKDIKWHMVGHLQTNKVKYIAPFVHLIHSVDSEKLLKEINKQAAKNQRIINVLLQVHIAEEESKFGLSMEEAKVLVKKEKLSEYPNVLVKGLMGMATLTENEDKIRGEFRSLATLYTELRTHLPSMDTLSMGMSGDYKIALEEGSTMIRIGSAIFGARN